MLSTPLTLIPAAAIAYPDGVSESNCLEAIPKLDSAVKALMSAGGQDIKDSAYKAFFADDTLNGIFAAVYKEIGASADSLSAVGVELTPAVLAQNLSAYKDVSAKLSACKTLDEAIKNSVSFKWGISDKNGFAAALSAMFSPLNELLYTVLCGGTLKINALMSIKGDNGYQNTLVPLLQTLECPSVMSQANFTAAAGKNRGAMLQNLALMLFSALDKIFEAPVSGVCSVLPALAYYIDSGALKQAINKLVEPLSLRIGIFTIPGISSLLSSVTELENGFDISALLKNADFSKITGSDIKLTLPEISMEELAACAAANEDGTISSDRAAALITVLRWLTEALKLNRAQIISLTGMTDSGMLDSFINKDADSLIKLIINLFTMSEAPIQNSAVWSAPTFTPSAAAYTANLTQENFQKVLNEIDALLDEVAAEADPEATIESVLTQKIYSGSLLSNIAVGLFSAVGSEKTAPLLSLLGIDATPAGVAQSIAASYPSAAAALRQYSSWEKVNADNIRWGFSDGNKSAFKTALTALLSPFSDIFRFLLAEDSLTLFGAVTLSGADGYNSAVIPLLEALSCDSGAIKSYDEYKAGADINALFTAILDPLFELIDRVCKKPVYTLCEILPNAVYFLNGGGLGFVIENLLFPLTEFLKQAGLSDVLAGSTEQLKSINLSETVQKLTDSAQLPIKLPQFDFGQIAAFGTAEQRTSRRTVSGGAVQYSYIKADGTAVLVTLLRYLVSALGEPENEQLLSGLMSTEGGEQTGTPDMMAMYAAKITDQFKTMTVDEIIEWLYDLLFSESPKKEDKTDDGYIPTIIYEEPAKSPLVPILITLLCLAVVLFFVLRSLSMRGKLDGIKEKARNRQRKKALKKEQRKEKRAARRKAPAQSSEKAAAPTPVQEALQAAEKKSKYINSLSIKEAEKLYRRQNRAANRALKNTKKADRYYAQALLDAKRRK